MKKIRLLDGTSVDFDLVVEQIKESIEFDNWKEDVGKLKGFDLWPFDDDGDEFEGPFEEMRHNAEIMGDAILATITLIEKAFQGVMELENPQKHAICREILDDAIRLPFYAEWADGPIIDMMITLAVRLTRHVQESDNQIEPKFNGASMQLAVVSNVVPSTFNIAIVEKQLARDEKKLSDDLNMGE